MNKVALAIALVFSAANAFGECTDADKRALEQFDRSWGEASLRGDRSALEGIFADDFVDISFTGTLGKRASIDEAIRTAEQRRADPAPSAAATFDHYHVACTPNTATITHRTTRTSTADGRQETRYSRSIHALEKRGGRWQVVSSAGHQLDDAAVLLYLEAEWNDAIKNRDVAWFERNFAADATDITRTGAVENKAQSIASTKDDKRTFDLLELSELDVRVQGNTARVVGVNHLRGRDVQGKPLDLRVRFTDIWRRSDGRWQVWSTQSNEIAK